MFSKLSKSGESSQVAGDYINSVDSRTFEEIAIALFRYQYAENELYQSYCKALRIAKNDVSRLSEIPFLPISFFKTHKVWTGPQDIKPAFVFESSGTTGDTPSRHYVRDAALYEQSLLSGFHAAFGAPEDYAILALLPSYLERGNASLVQMTRTLMAHSGAAENGFYLNEWALLSAKLQALKTAGRKTLLLGVTFALLDFAEASPMDLAGITIMETGGMKGRREEWTRAQVHEYLKRRWQLEAIATEYGMTELLSQAYAQREGLLSSAATMRVMVRDISDPLSVTETGSGALNIIDLANVHSCAFIATEDVGIVYDQGSFEVLGRLDHAALRGCSLMTAQ